METVFSKPIRKKPNFLEKKAGQKEWMQEFFRLNGRKWYSFVDKTKAPC